MKNINKIEDACAMKPETENLRKVKDAAIALLETPVKTTKLPLGEGGLTEIELVVHPFFTGRFVCWNPDNAEHPHLDILGSDDDMQEALRRYKGFIEKSESIDSILLLMAKSYRLPFFKLIQKALSPDEMGRMLADIWVGSENPNDSMVPLSTLIKWFKQASRESLMDAEELAYYDSLPDEFTVYRGIGSKSNKKGISYTLSLEKAEWFAKRFQQKKGYVLAGTAKKKDVLAYFNSRKEQEVLIEPKNISGLHKM